MRSLITKQDSEISNEITHTSLTDWLSLCYRCFMNYQENQKRIKELERQIKALPPGTVVYKKIKGRQQPYLQWSENGKTRSKYIKKDERDIVMTQVQLRRQLADELKELKSTNSLALEQSFVHENLAHYSAYSTRVVTGAELDAMTNAVNGLEKRDSFDTLMRFVNGDGYGRICLLYGLRRTGKTTMLLQAIDDLAPHDRKRAVYIKARTSDTMADMNRDLRLLAAEGYKYFFIDEITLLSDFIDSASLFSDVYAMQGLRIVLSGTDSLGFWFTLANELYDRAVVIHTTFISFSEYRRLLDINDIDEYIRYGGTLMRGETDYGDVALMDETASFRDDESTRRYIDSSIASNIQHSLECCKDGAYFRNLRTLYNAGELTGAINRILESMTHQFLIETLKVRFKSHDLGSAAELLRKQPDESKRTDILDRIDRDAITAKLMELLEIRNEENRKVGITDAHVSEIKEYLKALDLVVDCPSESVTKGGAISEYVIFTQPGMRYSQAEALVYVLMHDDEFNSFDEEEKLLACDKILEEVRGRMMEDIILHETARSLPREHRAFHLTLARGEIDMLVVSPREGYCEAFEIKHSKEIVPRQYHILEDEEQCRLIEARFGVIKKKSVIFRGNNAVQENGIEYRNAEDYLCSLKR